jgi:hypothetical protein
MQIFYGVVAATALLLGSLKLPGQDAAAEYSFLSASPAESGLAESR